MIQQLNMLSQLWPAHVDSMLLSASLSVCHYFNSFSFYLFKSEFLIRMGSLYAFLLCVLTVCKLSSATSFQSLSFKLLFCGCWHDSEVFLNQIPCGKDTDCLKVFRHFISVMDSHFTQGVLQQMYLKHMISPNSSILYVTVGVFLL